MENVVASVFTLIVMFSLIFWGIACWLNDNRFMGTFFLFLASLCLVVFLTANLAEEIVYYKATCNEAIYSVYEANDNYYLTETNARIILPNCVLIENQND